MPILDANVDNKSMMNWMPTLIINLDANTDNKSMMNCPVLIQQVTKHAYTITSRYL